MKQWKSLVGLHSSAPSSHGHSDLEPDLEIEGGAAVSRGVEEAEHDAAVHPAAHQHRHPERRPPRSRAPEAWRTRLRETAAAAGGRRREV